MREFIHSSELRAVIAQSWIYYGLPATQISAVYFGYAWTEYHLFGGFYPVGRSQTISDAMHDLIIEHGGRFIFRDQVDEILLKDNVAYGVATKKGHTYHASKIISNADPFQTFTKLMSSERLPERYMRKIQKLRPSLSGLQAYVILDLDFAETYKEHCHEIFINEHPDFTALDEDLLADRYDQIPLSVTIYENIYPEYHVSGKTTVSLFVVCEGREWFELSDDAYAARKQYVLNMLLDRFDRVYPGVKEAVEFAELSTPRTIQRFTQQHRGAIYGSAQTVDQSLHRRLQQNTPVDNLHLAGAWTFPGHGYTGVIYSGYNIANQIIQGGSSLASNNS